MRLKNVETTIWVETEYLSVIPSFLRCDSIREIVGEDEIVAALDERIRELRSKFVNDREIPYRINTMDPVDRAFLFLMIHLRDTFAGIVYKSGAEVVMR